MGLSLLSPLQDPQSEIRRLQQELYARNRQLHEAELKLRDAESDLIALRASVVALRTVLEPLHRALGMVFGEIEATGVRGAAAAPAVNAIWEDWKRKLGGKAADAIDALLLHGEMNADQLRIHLKCARTHVYNVISQLNKAGVIRKNGGRISLKEL